MSAGGDPLGLAGQVLHGQFRVDEVVEHGARSITYRGQHLMLEVPIAIKCMRAPPGAAAETFIRKFRYESRLHYKLAQGTPHIVRVLASGTAVAPAHGGLCPFMVLEWQEGVLLAHDLAERRAQRLRGRSLAECIRLLDPAVEALAYAHACGVVHRELTPDCLFIASTPEGPRLKITDLGVAKIVVDKALDLPADSSSLGMAAVHAPAYAAPEQFVGAASDIGPWTDVYSLVMILMEALTDRVVMDDGGAPVVLKATDATRRPTPRALGIPVGDHVEAVLAQAVSLRPAERQEDIGLFWGMLKNAARKDSEAEAVPSAVPTRPGSVDYPPRAGTAAQELATVTPRTLAQSTSPMAASLLQAGGDTDDTPASEHTTVMNRDALPNLAGQDDPAEPVNTEGELFVSDENAVTTMYDVPSTLAGISTDRSGAPEMVTMVSSGTDVRKQLEAEGALPAFRVPPAAGRPSGNARPALSAPTTLESAAVPMMTALDAPPTMLSHPAVAMPAQPPLAVEIAPRPPERGAMPRGDGGRGSMPQPVYAPPHTTPLGAGGPGFAPHAAASPVHAGHAQLAQPNTFATAAPAPAPPVLVGRGTQPAHAATSWATGVLIAVIVFLLVVGAGVAAAHFWLGVPLPH